MSTLRDSFYEVPETNSGYKWLQNLPVWHGYSTARFEKRPDFGRFPNRAVQIPEGVSRVVEVLQPLIISEYLAD